MSFAQPHNDFDRAFGDIKPGARRVRNMVLWGVCVLVWFALDLTTKLYANGFDVGDSIAPDVAGLIGFRLVHNFGVAWGAFSGAVGVISVFTALLCVAIAVFSVYWSRGAGRVDMVALGILFAGGVGNLLDRVALGYVVDFIEPLFIDFPIFNVADIGVTCGIVLLMASLIVQMVCEGAEAGKDRTDKEHNHGA